MPATASRIGFIQQDFRRVVSSTAAMKTRYGTLARESAEPVETYFDNVVDAQAVANARQALLGTERRRLNVRVGSADEVLALSYIGAVPVARIIDAEKSVDRKALVSEITVELDSDKATLGVWG